LRQNWVGIQRPIDHTVKLKLHLRGASKNFIVRLNQKRYRLHHKFVTFQHQLLQLKCTWSSVFKNSDSVVEEFLIVVIQPAICRADCFLVVSFASCHELQLQPSNNLCSTVVLDGTNQWHNVSDIYNVHQATNFLNSPRNLQVKLPAGRPRSILYWKLEESELWSNAGLSALQLQEAVLKSDKIWCTFWIRPICVRLRSFCTTLVLRLVVQLVTQHRVQQAVAYNKSMSGCCTACCTTCCRRNRSSGDCAQARTRWHGNTPGRPAYTHSVPDRSVATQLSVLRACVCAFMH